MALITGTLSVTAGNNRSLTLNRSELAALITDTFYSDSSNWKRVTAIYVNQSQEYPLHFDGQTGDGKFVAHAKALNGAWKIKCFIIRDYMGGTFTFTQGQIPSLISYNFTTSGGVDYSSAAPVGDAIVWGSKANYTTEEDGGVTSTQTVLGTTTADVLLGSQAFDGTQDFHLTYNYTKTNMDNNTFFGFCDAAQSVFSGFLHDNAPEIIINNAQVALNTPISASGSVEFVRSGSTLNVLIDGVTKYTTVSSVVPASCLPVIRLGSGIVIESATLA